MTTAFVLSGGAGLGALQVGMLQALLEHDVQPDFIVGTSAGAINAAYFSKYPTLDGVSNLAELWQGLNRGSVFPVRPALGFLGFIGKRDHLCSSRPLLNLLRSQYGAQQLQDSPVPAHVIAADLSSGHDVCVSHGPSADAVLASASLPGVFPPVTIDGRVLIDGGVTNNAPISHAVRLGATKIYVLACGHACALTKPPSGALAVVLQSVSVLIGRQLVQDVDRFEQSYDLRIIPQICPLNVSPLDFSQAKRLISGAYDSTNMWLETTRLGADQSGIGKSKAIDPHTH
jgi:NTE family protein